MFMEPKNRFQGINSASLCSQAGRYDNPIPPWFLAPIDSLKIPALEKKKKRDLGISVNQLELGRVFRYRSYFMIAFLSSIIQPYLTQKQKIHIEFIESTAWYCPIIEEGRAASKNPQ
jgi:hypothetical protein